MNTTTTFHTTLRTLLPLTLALILAACSNGGEIARESEPAAPAPAGSGNVARGCIDVFDPQKDYFPDKTRLETAKVFSVEYRNYYKVVQVLDPVGGRPAEFYVLLQCGAPKPELQGALASAPVVTVPITSLFASSTTHHPLLVELDRLDVLTGIPRLATATVPQVVERIRAGAVVEYGEESVINIEKVIQESPSMVMNNGFEAPAYAAIRNSGVPVIANKEWLENSALGRAEWVKFLALFLNEEAKAESVFETVRSAYVAMAERTKAIPPSERPKVMTGYLSQGVFSMAGGRSYVAQLIADAGGSYIWADDPGTGFQQMDIETVIVRAGGADFWLNGRNWTSLKMMAAEEPRYAEFKAFRDGQIWLYNRQVSPSGSNDYWSRGITRPDLILADLIKIFHPRLAADHEFEWYMAVPAS